MNPERLRHSACGDAWVREGNSERPGVSGEPGAVTYFLAFLFGLLGSTHCIGMCGPMVVLYSTRRTSEGPQRNKGALSPISLHRQHFLFNLGRAFLYTYWGFVFGLLGYLFHLRTELEGYFGVLGGLFIVLMGVNLMGFSPQLPFLEGILSKPARIFEVLWRQYRRLADSSGVFLLGCAHGFLPCPLLYTLFAFSASTGDPFRGALIMFIFSLGTIPAMWGLGALSRWLDTKKRGQVLRFMGGLTALWGTVLLAHGLEALGLLPKGVHSWVPEIPVFKREWFGRTG